MMISLAEAIAFVDYAAWEGSKYLPPDGKANPDVLFVKPSLSPWEISKGRQFAGDEGIALRTCALHSGTSKAGYMTLIPFFPNRDYKPKIKDIPTVTRLIDETFRRFNPTKVVLLGADACKLLPRFNVPYEKYMDIAYEVFVLDGISYMAGPALGSIANNPSVFTEFKAKLAEFLNPPKVVKLRPPVREIYRNLQEPSQIKAYLKLIPTLSEVAIDLETTGLEPHLDEILTLSVSPNLGVAATFPFHALKPGDWQQLLGRLKLVGHNIKFDLKFLAHNGVNLKAHSDTMLLHSLVDSTPGSHNMQAMASKMLGKEKLVDTVDYAEFRNGLVGMYYHPKSLGKAPDATQTFEEVGRYAARDCDITLGLYRELKSVEHLKSAQVLIRASNALTAAEVRGIHIDMEKAHAMSDELSNIISDTLDELDDTYGVNPNSPKQVSELLYKKLKLPPQKNGGKLTTASPFIEKFAENVPVVRKILDCRTLGKINSTYLKNIIEKSPGGVYHANFKLASTETGRITESLMTLIPRTTLGDSPTIVDKYKSSLRSLFVAPPGKVMFGADYSQLEVRILALLSQDPQLIEDINRGVHLHSAVAVRAFDLPVLLEPAETLKKRVAVKYQHQVDLTKTAVFASLYGGTAGAIAIQTGLSLEESQKIIDSLYERYPQVAAWQESMRQYSTREGCVSTPWGSKRHSAINKGMTTRADAEQLRQAINTPIQAWGSEINLAAFADCHEQGLEVLFPFHDAIYGYCPEHKANETLLKVAHIMEAQVDGAVVLAADGKWGFNWGDL
jgi:DNA polymerase I-like protein with 3'-5' exonuclease and polymerase domains/uracil-DNA glycosylase